MMIEKSMKKRGAGLTSSLLSIIVASGLYLGAGSADAFGREKFHFGIHGQGGFAQGEFRDNLRDGAGGANFEFFYSPFRSSPVSFGFSFGFLIYGIEHYQDIFSSRYADFAVDMTTTNSILHGLLSVRYPLWRGVIQPYVEGLAGFGIIKTDTSADNDDDSQIEMENLGDSFWSFGAGTGVMIRFLQVQNQRGRNLMEGMFDVRVRYLRGGRAEYLLEGGIERADGNLIYDLRESRTDLWMIQAGFLFKF